MPLLEKVSAIIRDTSHETHMIEVEGHTDDIPIANEQFPSNWELSAARATHVVKYLMSQGVAKERLKASSFADSRPKKTDSAQSIEQQRAANRRVVVQVRRY